MDEHGIDAPAELHAEAYANSDFLLWHANQKGRYNFQHGIMEELSAECAKRNMAFCFYYSHRKDWDLPYAYGNY